MEIIYYYANYYQLDLGQKTKMRLFCLGFTIFSELRAFAVYKRYIRGLQNIIFTTKKSVESATKRLIHNLQVRNVFVFENETLLKILALNKKYEFFMSRKINLILFIRNGMDDSFPKMCKMS